MLSAWRRCVVPCALLGLLTGCYAKRPLQSSVPAPATHIVAQVTGVGMSELTEVIGPGALELEAVVAGADAAVWSLRMLRVDHRDGRSVPWNRELIRVPRSALEGVMEKRVDRTRSWIAAGAIVASALVVAQLFHLIGADDGGSGEPQPQQIIMPGGGRRE